MKRLKAFFRGGRMKVTRRGKFIANCHECSYSHMAENPRPGVPQSQGLSPFSVQCLAQGGIAASRVYGKRVCRFLYLAQVWSQAGTTGPNDPETAPNTEEGE